MTGTASHVTTPKSQFSQSYKNGISNFGRSVGIEPTLTTSKWEFFNPTEKYPSTDDLIKARFDDKIPQLLLSDDNSINQEARLYHAIDDARNAHATDKAYQINGELVRTEQRRKTGRFYIHHPIDALKIALAIGITDEDLLCAIVLHDTVEDTLANIVQIRQNFGEQTADYVAQFTHRKNIWNIADYFRSKEKKYHRYNKNIMDSDVEATIGKLVDILANLFEPRNKTDPKGPPAMRKHAVASYAIGLWLTNPDREEAISNVGLDPVSLGSKVIRFADVTWKEYGGNKTEFESLNAAHKHYYPLRGAKARYSGRCQRVS